MEESFNRAYKDTLFRWIFGREDERSKRWRLDLYNALNGSGYTDPDALELTTIENVIYLAMKNDLSFLIDSRMTLYEQQSTFNPNMPLRGLMYFSQLYQKWLTKCRKDLFGCRIVKIPSPQYIVFYNGNREQPDTKKLRLSDSFMMPDTSGDFEWTATMVNINLGHNEHLNKNCKSLYDYNRYVGRIKSNVRRGLPWNEAISEAVAWAIGENLLEGFFWEHKAEVQNMSITEFDEELYRENRIQDAREEGIEIGMLRGAHDKAIEAAAALKQSGVALDVIARCAGLPLSEVERL